MYKSPEFFFLQPDINTEQYLYGYFSEYAARKQPKSLCQLDYTYVSLLAD